MKKKLGISPLIIPMPAVLVGTYGENEVPNAMTAAWAAACCHTPPCLGVAVRGSRLTYDNIVAQKAFTINVADTKHVEQVDYLGIVSGRKEPDQLAKLNMRTTAGDEVHAPLMDSCPVNVECALVQMVDLGTHSWVIGEVKAVHADPAVLDSEGKIDVSLLNPLVYAAPGKDYYGLGNFVGKAFNVGKKHKG